MMARVLVFLILIDGSIGVPGWIRQYQNLGNEVIMQLPLNWYENIDLLGFSLFSLFYINPVNGYYGFEEKAEDELKGEDPPPCSLKCELSFLDLLGVSLISFWMLQ